MGPMDFDEQRRFAEVPEGRVAYWEMGEGPAAIFLHAYLLNGFQWRDILPRLSSTRRCIAVDLLGMGHTEAKRGQELTLRGQATMLASFLDELGLDLVDLVGNDSGGGVCQVFAARYPARVRTMTLTNSEVHDNYPPAGLQGLIGAAKQGAFGDLLKRLIADPSSARESMGKALYENPEQTLTDEVTKAYLEPLTRSTHAIDDVTRYTALMEPSSTVEIEDELRELQTPTLVVWGTGDEIFPTHWAHWLRDTIPGCKEVVEVPGGKLCFPEEHPALLADLIQEFWKKN